MPSHLIKCLDQSVIKANVLKKYHSWSNLPWMDIMFVYLRKEYSTFDRESFFIDLLLCRYGQTGSGKTFTMQGPPQPTEETSGMIPRAVHQIYDVTQQLRQFGWEYTMEGTFLEIYNETIHDLLGDTASYGKIKHEIRH